MFTKSKTLFVRKGDRIFAAAGPFAVTFWRRGAVSLQFNGHFLQIVIGDWWKAT